jgi:ribosomal protein S18 acetylase RimI-like enzyme
MAIEIRRLHPAWEQPLARFFLGLQESEEATFFHPHPFSPEEARRLCAYKGKDLYYIVSDGKSVLAYGILRGWDEGFTVPSLGIAVLPSFRGLGLGRTLMAFLHLAAKQAGATRVRLRVDPRNETAIGLYSALGYQFVGVDREQLVGIIDL